MSLRTILVPALLSITIGEQAVAFAQSISSRRTADTLIVGQVVDSSTGIGIGGALVTAGVESALQLNMLNMLNMGTLYSGLIRSKPNSAPIVWHSPLRSGDDHHADLEGVSIGSAQK